MSHMATEEFPLENVQLAVRRLMKEAGVAARPLSKQLGGQTFIRDILTRKKGTVRGDKLLRLAEHFGVSVESILAGTATTQREGFDPAEQPKVIQFEGRSNARLRTDCPVYGTALGAEKIVDGLAIEQTTLNRAEIIEYRKRPPIANGIERVYGLYVQGASMYPALRDGAFLFAQWDAPLRVGDDVVVYIRPKNCDDDGLTADCVLVKRLVRRSAQYVELEQFNPARVFKVAMKDVLRIDRVLTPDDYA